MSIYPTTPQAPKIEKGVPLPPKRTGRPGMETYPFREMKVGDSILLRTKTSAVQVTWAKATGWKFTVRRLPEDGGKARIWRVA